MKAGVVFLAALLLAACTSATTATTPSPSASPSSTASPPVVAAHFITPEVSIAKIAAAQSGVDPFSDFIGIHEVGLSAGQKVTYHVVGTASANYSCNRTDGTLDSAPGSQQIATARADVTTPFSAASIIPVVTPRDSP